MYIVKYSTTLRSCIKCFTYAYTRSTDPEVKYGLGLRTGFGFRLEFWEWDFGMFFLLYVIIDI